MKVLFVTWDGPQVSYLEGLFLPIFKRLGEHGLVFHVLQFTWGDATNTVSARAACELTNIAYRWVNVWRRPVSAGSFFTALTGARSIDRAVRDWGIDIVMPRSTLPALAAMVAWHRNRLPVVFDADGLPLDERVEFGGQSACSLTYRFLRDIEAQAVRRANVVLTRSSKASEVLQARAGASIVADKFFVVGNGRDAERFTPRDKASRRAIRARLQLGNEVPLLAYAGSLGNQYCLTEMLQLFERVHALRPDARFMVLSGSPELLSSALSRFPNLEEAVIALSVAPDEVPEYLACADVGLALRRMSFSMQAVAPIKLGEYLLCGLPVIATGGVGDTQAVNTDVGLLLNEMSEQELDHAAEWVVGTVMSARSDFREHCVNIGKAHFSLDASVESYLTAFRYVAQ